MMAPQPGTLAARWAAVWTRIGAGGDAAAVFSGLARRYAEPHRRYHVLDHIGECLTALDGAIEPEQLPRPAADEAEIALWFHDAVYDPRAGDNEARSAELAVATLEAAGVPDAVRERVRATVLATTHDNTPPTHAASVACDADLAILGADPGRYAAYAAAVGEEYSWVPPELFRARRAAVLERFLLRPSVYHTAWFRQRCETAARRNLTAELARLAPPGAQDR